MTFAEKTITFNASLIFGHPLPPGFAIMNPFRENECATPASEKFYLKYYNDNIKRGIILGINPGRFGAGITGVPFTDPKRLAEFCHIKLPKCPPAHEPSSEFIYDVVEAAGGCDKFYKRWYINSLCPLGFTREGAKGRPVNCNYYDTPALEAAALPFILKTLPEQINLGINPRFCVCLGAGKNFSFMKKLNARFKFFDEIIPLDHPRYIMQYKTRQRPEYVRKYIEVLSILAEKMELLG